MEQGHFFDDTTLGQFEVSESGTGYINGKLISWAAPQTEAGLTAGNTYIIYIDSAGAIQKTTGYTQVLFQNNIILFEVMRDSTAGTNNQVTVKENHPYDFQPAVSYWAHETVGVVIENHNNGANITLNGTQKIEISGADELSDHGLYTDIQTVVAPLKYLINILRSDQANGLVMLRVILLMVDGTMQELHSYRS